MATNLNPRERLAGWRLYPRCAWVLLALNLLVPASAWVPADWAGVRAIFGVLGCFAGGMLIGAAGAIWQRTEATEPAVYPALIGAAEHDRAALIGWRIHPGAARILLVCAIGGMTGLAYIPKEWLAVRAAALVLGGFAAGALAARDAAIWQRSGDK